MYAGMHTNEHTHTQAHLRACSDAHTLASMQGDTIACRHTPSKQTQTHKHTDTHKSLSTIIKNLSILPPFVIDHGTKLPVVQLIIPAGVKLLKSNLDLFLCQSCADS